jgi:hypothetical protein
VKLVRVSRGVLPIDSSIVFVMVLTWVYQEPTGSWRVIVLLPYSIEPVVTTGNHEKTLSQNAGVLVMGIGVNQLWTFEQYLCTRRHAFRQPDVAANN